MKKNSHIPSHIMCISFVWSTPKHVIVMVYISLKQTFHVISAFVILSKQDFMIIIQHVKLGLHRISCKLCSTNSSTLLFRQWNILVIVISQPWNFTNVFKATNKSAITNSESLHFNLCVTKRYVFTVDNISLYLHNFSVQTYIHI